jgi:hypothetical protein
MYSWVVANEIEHRMIGIGQNDIFQTLKISQGKG